MPYNVEKAIVFAEKPGFRALQLDIHRSGTAETKPLMLYVHGGGWRVSNRQRAPRETRQWTTGFFEQLVEAGFVVAANDYRFSSEAVFPAAVEDTVDAIRFLRANAASYGIDATKIVLFGQSAGGYLALAAGLGTAVEDVQGIVCWYPTTDFGLLDDGDSASAFPAHFLGGPLSTLPGLVAASSIPRLARRDSPPTLLQHGTADTMAPFTQSTHLRDALLAAGAHVELEAVEGAGHFFEGSNDVAGIFERAMQFANRCVA